MGRAVRRQGKAEAGGTTRHSPNAQQADGCYAWNVAPRHKRAAAIACSWKEDCWENGVPLLVFSVLHVAREHGRCKAEAPGASQGRSTTSWAAGKLAHRNVEKECPTIQDYQTNGWESDCSIAEPKFVRNVQVFSRAMRGQEKAAEGVCHIGFSNAEAANNCHGRHMERVCWNPAETDSSCKKNCNEDAAIFYACIVSSMDGYGAREFSNSTSAWKGRCTDARPCVDHVPWHLARSCPIYCARK